MASILCDKEYSLRKCIIRLSRNTWQRYERVISRIYFLKVMSTITTTKCGKFICTWSYIIAHSISEGSFIPGMSQKYIMKVKTEKNLGIPQRYTSGERKQSTITGQITNSCDS